jgi:ABC-type polysaccharide/polyol phosphate export permease
MTVRNLLRAEITMLIGELKQYALNYIFYNLGALAIFIGLFITVNQSDGGMSLLFGLVMWQIASGAIGYLGYIVQDEAMLGTLEQIFMTRTSIFKVFLSKVVVNLCFSLVKAMILFAICVFLFGIQGELFLLGGKNCLLVLFIIIVTEISFYMMGLMFGGLALFFKRVSNVVQLLNYVLLFFTNITVQISSLPSVIQIFSATVPIRWAMDMIRCIVNENSIRFYDVVGFLVSAFCYCIIGVIVFLFSVRKAKDKGKLAGY